MTRSLCSHVPGAVPEPQAEQCQECGSRHSLRLCATCGHVGCCESQLGHGREHALGVGHPVILSLPLSGGSFTWCYEHNDYVQSPAALVETRSQ
ncbi:MAG: UBP-type zinc finger domain-containing protein [Candidatus Limnocylindria bacterium]